MTDWEGIRSPAALEALVPAAVEAFRVVETRAAAVDVDRRKAAQPALLAWSEQFVTDVAALTEEQRAGLAAAAGDEVFPFVVAVWATDMAQRLHGGLTALAGDGDGAVGGPVSPDDGDLWAAVDGFILEVAKLDSLDPVTTEVVRLRGARAHNCRVCRSRRSVQAITAGADEATFDSIDLYERSDLAEPLKVALRATDAVLWTPTAWPSGVADDVRRCFPPSHAVELVLDVVRNGANRIAVALGADAPEVTTGVEYSRVAPDGTLAYGLPTPG